MKCDGLSSSRIFIRRVADVRNPFVSGSLLRHQVKENHKQRENAIERWKNYVMRTSNHDYLVGCKKKQDKSIDVSRAKPRHGELPKHTVYHETLLKRLNTTVSFVKFALRNKAPRVLSDITIAGATAFVGVIFSKY